ncbi:MAG: bifunctional 4-hydroxy-2-oxoglutarate aldolase/2-dehydro-3-deoxy-phosphogluconate aldolase [Cellulomonas sp.]
MTALAAITPPFADAWFDEQFADVAVMVILRGLAPELTVELAGIAWAAGVRLLEVPVQDAESLRSLSAVVDAADGRPVGAGTVTDAELVGVVADAGARFTVAPGFDAAVSSASLALGLAHLPGVMTPADVHRATAAGHRWLKLFPASVVGSAMISALRGPFPGIRVVATGGIGRDNAQEFLAAGADVVSLGAGFAALAGTPALDLLVHRGAAAARVRGGT